MQHDEPESGDRDDDAQSAPPPTPAELARRSLPANLLAAALCGLMTLAMGDTMPVWPRGPSLTLVYLLMLPFVLIFPLAALANLGWAGRTLARGHAPLNARHAGFFALALALNLWALPRFAIGLRTLLAL